jgi:hypothetical protein
LRRVFFLESGSLGFEAEQAPLDMEVNLSIMERPKGLKGVEKPKISS